MTGLSWIVLFLPVLEGRAPVIPIPEAFCRNLFREMILHE
jgi:hypothetical protein